MARQTRPTVKSKPNARGPPTSSSASPKKKHKKGGSSSTIKAPTENDSIISAAKRASLEREELLWRHPTELDLIHPTHLTQPEIILSLITNAFSVPPPPSSTPPNSIVNTDANFTIIHSSDGAITTLPIGYRIPLMFVGKYLWDSVRLVLTSTSPPPEEEWEAFKFDILNLSRLTVKFLEAARTAEMLRKGKGMSTRWRSPMFDRVLTRYWWGWLVNRPEFVKAFWVEFQEEEYERDVLRRDWTSVALKGHNGFRLTPDEIKNGITTSQYTLGLNLNPTTNRYVWDNDAYARANSVALLGVGEGGGDTEDNDNNDAAVQGKIVKAKMEYVEEEGLEWDQVAGPSTDGDAVMNSGGIEADSQPRAAGDDADDVRSSAPAPAPPNPNPTFRSLNDDTDTDSSIEQPLSKAASSRAMSMKSAHSIQQGEEDDDERESGKSTDTSDMDISDSDAGGSLPEAHAAITTAAGAAAAASSSSDASPDLDGMMAPDVGSSSHSASASIPPAPAPADTSRLSSVPTIESSSHPTVLSNAPTATAATLLTATNHPQEPSPLVHTVSSTAMTPLSTSTSPVLTLLEIPNPPDEDINMDNNSISFSPTTNSGGGISLPPLSSHSPTRSPSPSPAQDQVANIEVIKKVVLMVPDMMVALQSLLEGAAGGNGKGKQRERANGGLTAAFASSLQAYEAGRAGGGGGGGSPAPSASTSYSIPQRSLTRVSSALPSPNAESTNDMALITHLQSHITTLTQEIEGERDEMKGLKDQVGTLSRELTEMKEKLAKVESASAGDGSGVVPIMRPAIWESDRGRTMSAGWRDMLPPPQQYDSASNPSSSTTPALRRSMSISSDIAGFHFGDIPLPVKSLRKHHMMVAASLAGGSVSANASPLRGRSIDRDDDDEE